MAEGMNWYPVIRVVISDFRVVIKMLNSGGRVHVTTTQSSHTSHKFLRRKAARKAIVDPIATSGPISGIL